MSQDEAEFLTTDPQGQRIGIVASRFNQKLVDALLASVLATLDKAGISESDIETVRVPGAHEIPYAIHRMAETGQFDCLIALGVIIAGETQHHAVIAQTTSHILALDANATGTPVINGILTVTSEKQAQERITGTKARGRGYALSALAMAEIKIAFDARAAEEGDQAAEFYDFDDADEFEFFDEEGGFEGEDEGDDEDEDFETWKS